jgi:hypothetical protein
LLVQPVLQDATPVTVALLVSVVPAAAAVGVTGIVTDIGTPAVAVSPAHVTTCPAGVQSTGKTPIVKLFGRVSLIPIAWVTSEFTEIVYDAGTPTTKLAALADFTMLIEPPDPEHPEPAAEPDTV